MTASTQELLTRAVCRPSPWNASRARGTSETMNVRSPVSFGPDRREITLRVSRQLSRRPWFHQALRDFRRLLALDDNWNGYGERAVHEDAVKRAMNVLNVVGVDGPRPDIVPTSDGGVQVEWSADGSEIEVEIPPVGPASVFIVEASGEESEVSAGARNAVWEQVRARVSEMGIATA